MSPIATQSFLRGIDHIFFEKRVREEALDNFQRVPGPEIILLGPCFIVPRKRDRFVIEFLLVGKIRDRCPVGIKIATYEIKLCLQECRLHFPWLRSFYEH